MGDRTELLSKGLVGAEVPQRITIGRDGHMAAYTDRCDWVRGVNPGMASCQQCGLGQLALHFLASLCR